MPYMALAPPGQGAIEVCLFGAPLHETLLGCACHTRLSLATLSHSPLLRTPRPHPAHGRCAPFTRPKPAPSAAPRCARAPQLGHYGGLTDELDSLKRDKSVLMVELLRLRQAQQVRARGRGLGAGMVCISRGPDGGRAKA
jgi:hypothetical protein